MRQTITLKNKTNAKQMSHGQVSQGRITNGVVTKGRIALGLNSKSLFKDNHTVMLKHKNETYYLRLTKNDKVILTK